MCVSKKEFLKRPEGRRTWFFEVYEPELLEAGVRWGPLKPVAEPEPKPEPEPEPEPEPQPRVERDAQRPPPPTPWEILGVEPDAEPAAVSKAFKELAKRYHPDRFEALDSEFKNLAHKKFVQLKAAHDELLGG
jgi:hypothetical protein